MVSQFVRLTIKPKLNQSINYAPVMNLVLWVLQYPTLHRIHLGKKHSKSQQETNIKYLTLHVP